MPATIIHESAADEMHGYQFGCDGFMSIDEVCKFLGADVAHDAVQRLLADRKLRWFKLRNRRVRICRRSLMEHVKRSEQ